MTGEELGNGNGRKYTHTNTRTHTNTHTYTRWSCTQPTPVREEKGEIRSVAKGNKREKEDEETEVGEMKRRKTLGCNR